MRAREQALNVIGASGMKAIALSDCVRSGRRVGRSRRLPAITPVLALRAPIYATAAPQLGLVSAALRERLQAESGAGTRARTTIPRHSPMPG